MAQNRYRFDYNRGFGTGGDFGMGEDRGQGLGPFHHRIDYSGIDYGHYGKGPKNWKRNDQNIMDDVCSILQNDPHVDASEMDVDVQDGVVILQGHIESRKMKRRAERVVETVAGVRDIRNELIIGLAPRPQPI